MSDTEKQAKIMAVREAVEEYFANEGAKYNPFDENNVANATYSLNAKFGHTTIFFHAYRDMLILHFILPLKASEEERDKVGEFLLRANYGLKVGGFDFDFNDGEISYRVAIYCGSEEFAPPNYEQIDAALAIGLMMIEKYGNALVKVMFGLAEPEDAVDSAEEDD